VDYLGIFVDVAAALEFDDRSVKQVVNNIQELKDKLPEAIQKCLAFLGCDFCVWRSCSLMRRKIRSMSIAFIGAYNRTGSVDHELELARDQ